MIINIVGIESVQYKTRKNTSPSTDIKEPKEPKLKLPTNLITAKVIEFKHLKFKVAIADKLIDVIVIDYKPKIIFSAKINTHWEYPKPSVASNRDDIYDLDIYWDYLYEDLEVKGIVKDNVFVINNDWLYKELDIIHKEYLKNKRKEDKLNKIKL